MIDRLYIEGGAEVIGGLSVSINKKEQPFWLEREQDYPSLLKWVSLQPILFYDVQERRAWLVDGASALLHLVRSSLNADQHDPESTYDWVYDYQKLKDDWGDISGRHAALKTLKSWDNLSLNLYITSKRVRDGLESTTEYSTFETRVKRILHSIEILIDRQVRVASQDGIRISQTLDPRASIVGFDVLDIITPQSPVRPRIQHIDSWGAGWKDLVPEVGITTIFGRGFGDLVRPSDASTICSKWSSMPCGEDYMAASMSTLKMLHELRFKRLHPSLGIGEFTKKLTWLSPPDLLCPCKCIGGTQRADACHLKPVQFLVSKWTPKRSMKPVNISKLDERGAVIFGHMPLLGNKKFDRDAGSIALQELEPTTASPGSSTATFSSISPRGSGQRALTPSTSDTSLALMPSQPTGLSLPNGSSSPTIKGTSENQQGSTAGSSRRREGKLVQQIKGWIPR